MGTQWKLKKKILRDKKKKKKILKDLQHFHLRFSIKLRLCWWRFCLYKSSSLLHNNPKVGAGAETLSLSIRILKLTSENEANAFNGTDGGDGYRTVRVYAWTQIDAGNVEMCIRLAARVLEDVNILKFVCALTLWNALGCRLIVHVAFLSLNRFKIFYLLFCLWISPFLIRIYQKPNLNGNVCQAFDL